MSKIKKLRSGGEFMSILQSKKDKKMAGLSIFDKADENVICVMEKKKTRKQKFIGNDVKSKENQLIAHKDFILFPHIPLGLERFIIFISGEGGLGKSGMTSFMIKQAYKHITKKIYYICGTSMEADVNISALKYVDQVPGEFLKDIDVEKDLNNSLIVFDDIDNWKEYHKDAINVLNKAYEVGRKFKINIIYISHNHTKATESKIYSEVNMYITNTAKDNRMFEKYLKTSNQDIEDMEEALKTDVFVCYNKNFHTVYTDKRIWKLE